MRMVATPKPQTDRKPAMAMKRTVPMGIHTGLEMMINGVKKIKPRMVAVRVRPVRKRRIPPEMIKVKKPTS